MSWQWFQNDTNICLNLLGWTGLGLSWLRQASLGYLFFWGQVFIPPHCISVKFLQRLKGLKDFVGIRTPHVLGVTALSAHGAGPHPRY